MEGPNSAESTKMNMEYWDEFMDLSGKLREASRLAEEARVEATRAATAYMEAWGQVWPLEERLKELVQSEQQNEAEIAEVRQQYETALQNFEDQKKISDPIAEDSIQKNATEKKAFEDFKEIHSKLMGK